MLYTEAEQPGPRGMEGPQGLPYFFFFFFFWLGTLGGWMVVLLTDPRNSTGAGAGRSGRAEDTSYFGPVRHASGDISTE